MLIKWRLQSEYYQTSVRSGSIPDINTQKSYLAPFLAELINHSLSTGYVPEVFKEAYITPRLITVDLDPSDVQSYQPISTYHCYRNCWRSSCCDSFCPISVLLVFCLASSRHILPVILPRRQCWSGVRQFTWHFFQKSTLACRRNTVVCKQHAFHRISRGDAENYCTWHIRE